MLRSKTEADVDDPLFEKPDEDLSPCRWLYHTEHI